MANLSNITYGFARDSDESAFLSIFILPNTIWIDANYLLPKFGLQADWVEI